MSITAGYGSVGNTAEYEDITIASSGTTSTVIDTDGRIIGGFGLPAALDGTTISLQDSDDDSTYRAYRKSGDSADFSIAVAASKHIGLEQVVAYNLLRYVKVVSGATETAERTIRVYYARY